MRILSLLLATLMCVTGHGQSSPNNGGFGSNSSRMIPMTQLPTTDIKDEIQDRFLRQEWTPALISFRHSTDQWQVPILFDIYSNKLYFLHEKQILEFVDSVSEFTMNLSRRDDSIKVTFRSFYPPIEQNTIETFYQVLVDGQFQLLKCKAKTIYLYKEQDLPEERRTYDKQLLYGYFPGKQLVVLKKDKEQLLASFPPEYASLARSIIESKKLKLKNEESLRELFSALNE